MNTFNKIIFVTLLLCGFSILIVLSINVEKQITGLVLGLGTYIGLIVGITAVLAFIYGLFQNLMSKGQNFWKSLYVYNMVITFVGFTAFLLQ